MAGIKIGPSKLPPRGHKRNEELRVRKDNLDRITDHLMNNTDSQTYAIDPEKLKEEPEILSHFNMANQMFEVSNPVKGKVYFWCRDDRNAVALKQSEARMWLGSTVKGWEVVGNGESFPESLELKAVDGRRIIGDTFLMRIDLDEYTRIHKRMLVVQKYQEMNLQESLGAFVERYEGLVSVTAGNADPAALYAQSHGGNKIFRVTPDPRGIGITKG
jgi:hypothetical protein